MTHSPPDGRTSRVLAIQRVVYERGSATPKEIAAELDVRPNDVADDLREYGEEMGLVRESRSLWRVAALPVQQRLGLLDHIALVLGRDTTSFLRSAGLGPALDRVEGLASVPERLRRRLDKKFVVHGEPARRYDDHEDVVHTVIDGLARELTLSFTYGGGTSEAAHIGFRPLSLVLYRRALYLLGRPRGASEVVRLAVERIHEPVLGDSFEYPVRWDPRKVLDPHFGIYADGTPERVILRFSAEKAHLVRVRDWHPTQELVDLPDGRVELRMFTAGPELERFVLEWGEHCEAVAPEGLRARVVGALASAARRYLAVTS